MRISQLFAAILFFTYPGYGVVCPNCFLVNVFLFLLFMPHYLYYSYVCIFSLFCQNFLYFFWFAFYFSLLIIKRHRIYKSYSTLSFFFFKRYSVSIYFIFSYYKKCFVPLWYQIKFKVTYNTKKKFTFDVGEIKVSDVTVGQNTLNYLNCSSVIFQL